MVNLIELQNKIHAQNKELGWWDEERPFSTFVCLFHSELSEAMEGDRKGLMDDHLPKYPMFQVELADFVIRCLDWLGRHGFTEYQGDYFNADDMRNQDEVEIISRLHLGVSMSFQEYLNDGKFEGIEVVDGIASCVEASFAFSDGCFGFDLYKIILEKVEYNKHRTDHKRENRAKEGGKKY